ncbi:DegT/DnrJ/EryC1/StrS family aminotransferase [Undibacterium sp.]|uniref:DegT/DnrJ/EryC1/StrS family aminotransferase n=1 Tax=Undibacterium sp. TaxID=1914977 RepID=UPI0025E11C05|nr:DegT/DnrJ/EryC1/StrS family aminotransferase [Undibacterium sp.]
MDGFYAASFAKSFKAQGMRHYRLAYAEWSCAEYLVIVRCILMGEINQGKYLTALSKQLMEYYSPSPIYLSNYGHHAIEVALRIFHRSRSERNQVIIPAYICPSVVQAIQTCGLIAVSVDVDDDLNLNPNAMLAAFGSRTLAVIAPHMYGCPAKIEQIEQICKDAQIFLIDDAAQVMGVRSNNGQLLGTFGDVGILSFAQSKTLVTGIRGSGGALIVNNMAHNEAAKLMMEALPPSYKRMSALLDFLWNYHWSAYTGNSSYYLGRLLGLFGWRSEKSNHYSMISNLEAGIALIQFSKLLDINRQKIRVAELYCQNLKKSEVIGFPQYSEGRYLARIMLKLPEMVDLTVMKEKLKKKGVESRLGYKSFFSQNTKNAEQLSLRMLGVPCGASMTPVEIEEICKILHLTLSEIELHSESNN